MNRIVKSVLAAGLLSSGLAVAQVPSLINYQGRLTDANGAPVTGSKTFAISIYDDATAGNLLYTESIGLVTLDANGVYSFQFGAAGTNYSLITETLASTDGTATTYQKTLANSGIVAGTASVTDGTYSWTEVAGNPGSTSTATATTSFGFVVSATVTSGGSAYTTAPAVTITGSGTGATATATVSNGVVTAINITNAGSGYTTGATITIAPPPSPFRVTYSEGSITATYATAPAAGQTISATYRYGASGITGALASTSQPWMAVSVNGTVQGARQRVLSVPFAMNSSFTDRALSAKTVDPRIGVKYAVSQLQNGPDLTPFLVSMPVNSRLTGSYSAPYFNTKGNGGIFNIPKTAKSVQNISCICSNKSVTGYSGGSTSTTSTGYSTISLKSRSMNGAVTSIMSQTVSGEVKNIVISGPFILDNSLYEYFVEVNIGINSTNGLVMSSSYNGPSISAIEVANVSNLSVLLDVY